MQLNCQKLDINKNTNFIVAPQKVFLVQKIVLKFKKAIDFSKYLVTAVQGSSVITNIQYLSQFNIIVYVYWPHKR